MNLQKAEQAENDSSKIFKHLLASFCGFKHDELFYYLMKSKIKIPLGLERAKCEDFFEL